MTDDQLLMAVTQVSDEALIDFVRMTTVDPTNIYRERARTWLRAFLSAEQQRRAGADYQFPELDLTLWTVRDLLGGAMLSFNCLRCASDVDAAAFADKLLGILLCFVTGLVDGAKRSAAELN